MSRVEVGSAVATLSWGLPPASLIVAGAVGAGVARILGTELAPAATDATTFTVLVNNLAVIGYLAIGVFTAGIGTLAVLALNGAVFGYAITAAIAGGYGSAILSGVVPHMFPELAGFLVAAVADMRLGLLVARRTLSRTDLDVAASGRRWIVAQVAAVALIIVGAIIEGEVSYV